MSITRRDFLKGAAAGVVALAATAAPVAAFAEAEETSYADTITWDETYDAVVCGFGLGGANTACMASDLGAKVLLAEKAPETDAGGCSKYAGQLVMSTDDPDSLYEYFCALADKYEHVTDYEALRVYCDEAAKNHDWLVSMGADPDVMGNMDMFEYPEMPGVDAVKIWLVTGKNNDSGYYRLMKSAVECRTDNIDVWYGSPVKHLIQDPSTKEVLGVQIEKDGQLVNVRALGGVVLATGGFENNMKMVSNYLDMPSVYTWAALYNEGDGIKLGIEAGADLWHMGICAGYLWGFVPDDQDPRTTRCYRPGSVPWAKNPGILGMMVGTDGTRWYNETQTHRHGRVMVGGEWIEAKHPVPAYVIWDDDAMKEKYHTIFGQWTEDGAEEIAKGWIKTADTLEELAEIIGLPAENIVAAADDINEAFDAGKPAQYERPAERLTPIRTAPFYAVKMQPTMYNTDGGPVRNKNTEILDTDGNVIPHLYSAGDLGSVFAHMYNGGGNIGECTIWGRIAGRAVAGNCEELHGTYYGEGNGPKPASAAGGTDTGNYKDGEYTAYGDGISGRFPVTVTITDGKIASVVVGDNAETEGIGSRAIAALPDAIVAAQSTEVDGIAGATVTSNAIKAAVKACLIEASV